MSVILTAYDDGGYSGGTMERPGLQKLLEDLRSGKIDIVAVYKVERLGRSREFAMITATVPLYAKSYVVRASGRFPISLLERSNPARGLSARP